MGHVIAGAGIGRDLALFGADVLNIWQPLDWELEIFYWTSHAGMRSSILDFHEQADLTFNQLLNDADVFFSNRRQDIRSGTVSQQMSYVSNAWLIPNSPRSTRFFQTRMGIVRIV